MNAEQEFVAAMKKRHEEALTDFGVPDKLILSEDVKLWRVTGRVIPVWKNDNFVFPPVVPVKSGDRVIGAATLFPKNGGEGVPALAAAATLTYDLPERLDFENGRAFTLFPECDGEYKDGVFQSNIKHLRLERSDSDNYFAHFASTKYDICTWEEV